MRALWTLPLGLLVLTVVACVVVSAEVYPVFHGYLGYDLYVRVDALREIKVNTTMTVALTVKTYDVEVYVYYLYFSVYTYTDLANVTYVSALVLVDTWIPANSTYVFNYTITPIVPGEIRASVWTEY